MSGISNLGSLGPDLPMVGANTGARTAFGTLLPPGSRVAAYVRSTGVQDGDDTQMVTNLVATLAAGLARCRSGYNDIVYVLPGHSESVADALMMTNLVAGTRVIGIGTGGNMPVFRWTATTSQWPITKADVVFAGLRLRLEGAVVVKAIVTTAADTQFFGCDIEVASGASLKSTIAFEIGTAAHRCQIVGNVWRGTATHNVTDGIKVVGVANDVRICDNEMLFSATAGNGNIHVTAAALNIKVLRNYLYNTHTSSTACVALDDVAADGIVADNYCGVLSNGTASSQGVVPAGTTNLLVKMFQNYCDDEKGKSGLLCPVAAT